MALFRHTGRLALPRCGVLFFALRTPLVARALSSTSSSSDSSLKVAIITGTTRTGGPPAPVVGPRVAKFVEKCLEEREGVTVTTIVDPTEFPLLEKPEFKIGRAHV